MPNFMILDSGPVASPGCCGVCGYTGQDRKYSDLRKDFEFYGTFILCELCVGALAQDYGFLEPTRAQAIQDRALEVESELVKLRAAYELLEKMDDALSNFNFERNLFSNDALAGSSTEGNNSEPPQESIRGENVVGDNAQGEGRGNSPLDFDVNESGSDDLLHLAAKLNAGELVI
jgi:hypothetical protein